MAVGLNPSVNFTGYRISDKQMAELKEKAQNNPEMLSLLDEAKTDEYTADDKNVSKKKPKKQHKLKKGLASIAKFFTATEEITKGTAKGAVYGSMTGIGLMAAGWLLGALPHGFKKGNSLKEVFKHPIKSISKSTKITSALAAIGVATYHIIRGKLQANQRNAFVDQKLRLD